MLVPLFVVPLALLSSLRALSNTINSRPLIFLRGPEEDSRYPYYTRRENRRKRDKDTGREGGVQQRRQRVVSHARTISLYPINCHFRPTHFGIGPVQNAPRASSGDGKAAKGFQTRRRTLPCVSLHMSNLWRAWRVTKIFLTARTGSTRASFFPPSRSAQRQQIRSLSCTRMAATPVNENGNSLESVSDRAKLFEDMKIDVLTAAYEADNDLARHVISRSFTCESLDFFYAFFTLG